VYATDISYHEFKKLYSEAVSEPYGFFVIDATAKYRPLKYRSKFDGLYVEPKKTSEKIVDMESGQELKSDVPQ
jgi:hypothetical protein